MVNTAAASGHVCFAAEALAPCTRTDVRRRTRRVGIETSRMIRLSNFETRLLQP